VSFFGTIEWCLYVHARAPGATQILFKKLFSNKREREEREKEKKRGCLCRYTYGLFVLLSLSLSLSHFVVVVVVVVVKAAHSYIRHLKKNRKKKER